jgi:integrase
MPRVAKNSLKIEEIYSDNGATLIGWRMFGYVFGEKIRRRVGPDEAHILEKEKTDWEAKIARREAMKKVTPIMTWLTEDQVREMEAMVTEFAGLPRKLPEYVRAGKSILGNGERVKIDDALIRYEAEMSKEQMLAATTVDQNVASVRKFKTRFRLEYLDEITNDHFDKWGSMEAIEARDDEAGPSMLTKISKISRIRTFANWCVRKKMLAKSPLEIDMKALVQRATQRKKKQRIVTPEQAKALLDAAINYDPRWVPFVVFTTWLFMRAHEARMVKPEHVHLDAKRPYVDVWPKKQGTVSYRTVNIPENMRPILQECMDRKDELQWTSAPRGDESEPHCVHFDQTGWKTLRAEAGLVELSERNAKGYRAVVGGIWQENILRHTGISYLYQKFSDEADEGKFDGNAISASVCRQAGNSEDVAFKHYIRLPAQGGWEKFYGYKFKLKKAQETLAQMPAQNVA